MGVSDFSCVLCLYTYLYFNLKKWHTCTYNFFNNPLDLIRFDFFLKHVQCDQVTGLQVNVKSLASISIRIVEIHIFVHFQIPWVVYFAIYHIASSFLPYVSLSAKVIDAGSFLGTMRLGYRKDTLTQGCGETI